MLNCMKCLSILQEVKGTICQGDRKKNLFAQGFEHCAGCIAYLSGRLSSASLGSICAGHSLHVLHLHCLYLHPLSSMHSGALCHHQLVHCIHPCTHFIHCLCLHAPLVTQSMLDTASQAQHVHYQNKTLLACPPCTLPVSAWSTNNAKE